LKELESLLKKDAEIILFFTKEGYDIDIDDLNAILDAGPANISQVSV
jgi:hypothetical protein